MAAIGMAVQLIQQKLYRSNGDKIIAGICGGLSDYFNVDPVIFRVLFVVLTFVNGIGLLLYVILWIVVPREHEGTLSDNKNAGHTHEPARGSSKRAYPNVSTIPLVSKKRSTGRIIVAAAVILIGTVALLSNLFSVNLLRFEILWPLFLILTGLYLIF